MNTENFLKKLTIRGFKSIRNAEISLQQLNILIGVNGAGKSNFIAYFKMLSEMLNSRLQIYVGTQGGADRIVSYGVKKTTEIYSSLEFGENVYLFELKPTVDDKLIFSRETVCFILKKDGLDNPHYRLGASHFESKLETTANKKSNSQKVSRYCYDAISSWRIYHFQDTSDTAGVKRISSLQDNLYLRSDASNLAAFLYKLKTEQQTYQQIIKTIQLVLPYFADFLLIPTMLVSGEEQIRLLWQQTINDYPLWPSQLSDGSLRFICLVVALMQPNPPSTIIIDEPELGLHPYAINILGGLLRSAAKTMQVIISTQSVALLNEFTLDDLIIAELNKDGESSFVRKNSDDYSQWLENYTIGELWEKNVLGGRPHS